MVALMISAAIIFGLRAYFGSYFAKKAEALATKEDIGDITRIIEAVKDQNARELAKLTEALRAQSSLRLLAGERRLETHQKAYMLWREMISTVHDPDPDTRGIFRNKFHDFFFENCLYLDPKVRATFLDAITSFDVHHDLTKGQALISGRGRDMLAQTITENYARVRALGDAITEACELPSIAGKPETFVGGK